MDENDDNEDDDDDYDDDDGDSCEDDNGCSHINNSVCEVSSFQTNLENTIKELGNISLDNFISYVTEHLRM